MKKIILGLSLLLVTQESFALSIENSAVLLCESKAARHLKSANPMICVKAAKLSEKSNKQYAGESYYNAAQMYEFSNKYRNYKKAFEMYMKSYDNDFCNLDSECAVGDSLGYFYATGQGVKANKILAYKYFIEAAKKGNLQAQSNLDNLCKRSPWVCK